MDDKTLVERLDTAIKDDHERGCQGRYYSCTCGYDNDCSQAMQDAKSRIEALEAEKLKSLALQDLAYQNGAQQYAAMAAQSPEAAAKWLQNLSRRSDGLRVLNDAKQALESQL